jgi:hypothetical protein
MARGDPEEALDELRRAMVLVEEISEGLSDEETFRAREQRARVFALAAAAAFETRGADLVFRVLERGRAAALLDAMGTRDALREVSLPRELVQEIRRAQDGLAYAQKRLSHARESGVVAAIREARTDCGAAEHRLEETSARAERELRRAAGIPVRDPLTAKAFRLLLRPDEVFVHLAVAEGEVQALLSTARESRMVSLGKAEPIEALARRVLERAEGEECEEGEPRADLQRLRRALVDPMRLPDGARAIHLSPDGALSYVPWPALLPEHDVACVPSGSTLRLLVAERPRRGDGILALGDPDYLVDAPSAADRGVHRDWWQRLLPATRDEVLAIARIGKSAARNRVLLGKAATEASFRDAVASRPRWRSIHFACHGRIDRSRPRLSALALAQDAQHDGLLTSPEVFGIPIHADLVVLSACASGRDRFVGAEGVSGLLRAFLAAGAPRILVSLWKVDDEATKELMVRFYERWLVGGVSPSEALRDAQRHVADQDRWRHPRYWAAWVLWGLAD